MLAVGVALRVVAYVQRSVLWLDEAALARNVMERSFGELLTVPLDYGQAAPKGFLVLEWLVTRVAGTSDLAFRFVPFVAGIASLVLFSAIARRVLTRTGALAALLFFAVGYWFIVYASDAHPYGLDLTLSLGALLLTIEARQRGLSPRRVWALAAFGALAVWFSNATVLTLVGLGAALGVVTWRADGLRAALRRLWPIAIAWAPSAAAAAWVATHSVFPSTARYFDWLWASAMVPVPRSRDAALWLWRVWRVQLALWHGWSTESSWWTSLYPCLMLIGFVSLVRRRTESAVLLASVVAAFVVASMAKQYPFEARLVLPALAIFMIGIGESIAVLANAAWGKATPLAHAAAGLLCIPPVYRVIAFPPPYQWTVTGAYLAGIRQRWQPNDVVYTSYGRALEVMHAARSYGLGLRDYVLGTCNRDDPAAVLRAVDMLRGRPRVWVIVDPGLYFPASIEYRYLRTIGIQRDSLGVSLPGSIRQSAATPFDISTAYLFDLSDSTRLGHARANAYVVSPLLRLGLPGNGKWNCYGVWSPMVRESARR